MGFFITNNLNRQDFIAFISEWNGKDDWTEKGQGYPSLQFDFRSQSLFLQFQRFDSLESIKFYKLDDFKFSINQKRHVLLFEFNGELVDVAISFKHMEFCVRFKALLIHYIQIRKLNREEAK